MQTTDQFRDRLVELQDAGVPFTDPVRPDLEDFIAELPISTDLANGLWLLAWSRVPDEDHRWKLLEMDRFEAAQHRHRRQPLRLAVAN